MRADRLLSIMLLLQVERRITARELAHRLEVSERTIHRDMQALSVAGVPLIAERGSGGGWSLIDAYRTDLTGLNGAEIQAVFLSQSTHILSDLGLRQAAQAALIKLFAALPSVGRRDAEYARQRIHIDGAGWHRAAEVVPMLPRLQEAVWQERRVQLCYQRGDGTLVERLIDPLGLVVKGRTWYLIAAVDGEVRNYRVSRVQRATITDQPCMRSAAFDLAACWEQSVAAFKANLPRYPVTLSVAPEVLPRLRSGGRFVKIERIDPPGDDGRSVVAMRFDVEWAACEYVLSFGPQIEVLEPPTLRDQVIEQARRVLQLYNSSFVDSVLS